MRYCPGCGQPIAGRGEFCSDACSKSWWLAGDAPGPSHPDAKAMVIEAAPIAVDDGALLDALTKVSDKKSNKRVFHVTYEVTFQSDNPAGEWDGGLINRTARERMAGLMKEILLRSNHYFSHTPLWQIDVKCTSRYDELLSRHDG